MADSNPKTSDAVENTTKALQKATDEAEKNGYYGERQDDTPLADYSVAGVTRK